MNASPKKRRNPIDPRTRIGIGRVRSFGKGKYMSHRYFGDRMGQHSTRDLADIAVDTRDKRLGSLKKTGER